MNLPLLSLHLLKHIYNGVESRRRQEESHKKHDPDLDLNTKRS